MDVKLPQSFRPQTWPCTCKGHGRSGQRRSRLTTFRETRRQRAVSCSVHLRYEQHYQTPDTKGSVLCLPFTAFACPLNLCKNSQKKRDSNSLDSNDSNKQTKSNSRKKPAVKTTTVMSLVLFRRSSSHTLVTKHDDNDDDDDHHHHQKQQQQQ